MKHNKIPILLLLTWTACMLQNCSGKKENTLNQTPVNVEVEQIKNTNENESISYSGTIEESESLPLCFSGIGTVARVYVSDGDFVKKGQLLAELNNNTYKNAYEIASATLKQAEDAYKRLEPMYKNGNLPEIKFVEVETALQQAKASTAIAKKNLDDCKLYSPVNGVVGKRSIDPGMSAMPNLASINIVKIDKVLAKVPVAEGEIGFIKRGGKAIIKIAALNNAQFSGTVEEIGVLADPLVHTYKIKIGIQNKDLQIKPGMICNVSLTNPQKTPGLSVPSRAVLVDELGRNFVYVINRNRAERKFVKMGKLLQNGVEIINGLNKGELIVTAGQQKLVDSSLVHIVNQ